MRNRAYRRHKAISKMQRRLKEDRNQHYNDLTCPCWWDGKTMARFKEQPQLCSKEGCGCRNQRHIRGRSKNLTMQEARFMCEPVEVLT